MSLEPAKAISFDVDGTLYRVQRFRVAWRLRRERGLMVALLAAREKIRQEPPLEGRAELVAREVDLVAPSFRLAPSEALERLELLQARLPEALCRGMRPFPGVRAALEAAHARGLKLLTLSDFAPEAKLEYLGLADLPWVGHVGAAELGALKPHPGPFLETCRLAGCAPHELVHVGDREDVDVEGALAAGIRAWRTCPPGRVRSRAEHIFSRWKLDLFAPLFPR